MDGGAKGKARGRSKAGAGKGEPIKWRVLTDSYTGADADSGNKTLLFCESGIYAGVPYYDNTTERTIGEETIYPNNYEHSRIRAWLNGLSFQLDTSTNSERGVWTPMPTSRVASITTCTAQMVLLCPRCVSRSS